MSSSTVSVLTAVLILAAAIWLGGLVTIAVVARVASATLVPSARVEFFQGLGRAYGVVGGTALVIAYGTGAALVHDRPWDGLLTGTAVVAAALAATLAAGIVQARRMTRLRRSAIDGGADAGLAEQVRHGAQRAGALRGLIGMLSLGLLALGVAVGT